MFQFNPYVIPLVISLFPISFILRTAWQRRDKAVSRMLFGFVAMSTGFVISYAFELSFADLALIKWALRFEYIFHGTLMFWLLFALVYSGDERWTSRRWMIAIFLPLALVCILVWTNDYHCLIWSRVGTTIYNGLVFFDRDYGPVFYVWMGFFYICSTLGSILLLRVVIRSHALYQLQGFLIVLSTIIPTVTSVLTVLDLTPVPNLDLVPYGVALACLPLAMSIFRYRLLDIMPTAHREVIYSLRDAVIICDADSRIIDLNPVAQRFNRHMTKAALGNPLVEILPQMQKISAMMIRANIAEDEFELTDVEGKHIFEVAAHRLREADFVKPGIAYILRDVTTRRWAEQRATEMAFEREKVRLLSDFIETASHDFRTPLSSLKLTSQILQRLSNSTMDSMAQVDPPLPLALQESITKMNDRIKAVDEVSEQLLHLVNGMLQVVQLDNEPVFDFVDSDLNKLVTEQIKGMSGRMGRKNQIITQEFASDLPPVRFDAWRLGQAIHALLDNAHRYTAVGGQIKVSTSSQWDKVVVKIEDSGIGIGSSELPHIFERFYRADPARSVSAGAGLGLPIALAIAEAHGGRIDVKSEADKGSTFLLVLAVKD